MVLGFLGTMKRTECMSLVLLLQVQKYKYAMHEFGIAFTGR